MGILHFFLIDIQLDMSNNEKFCKKVLAGSEKGCTFAARKQGKERLVSGDVCVEFFDRLGQHERAAFSAGRRVAAGKGEGERN